MEYDPGRMATAETQHEAQSSKIPLEAKTERLFIRRLIPELDLNDLFAIRSRMDVMKWSLTRTPDADIAATKEHLRKVATPENLILAVFEYSNTERAIACIGFYTNNGNTSLGYIVHPDCWGKGYAAEATRAAIDIWWKFLTNLPPEKNSDGDKSPKNYFVLEAITDASNVASNRVLTKCGFKMVEEAADELGPCIMWELHKEAKLTD
ncbi:acetyltransferase [Histoplasma capsulatum var. duboisii H88]|uniref:Acetyltransferase n=2 Tax=Ajellomyces capsulatus TaxID=5037 RepID=A0A8A1LC51_AJEC8|nr:acetyltransferase [Histoplasma capsulatum H143]QSS50034.1 acetyltransferase [Histoplasma capsulatum var. duboisii H88]